MHRFPSPSASNRPTFRPAHRAAIVAGVLAGALVSPAALGRFHDPARPPLVLAASSACSPLALRFESSVARSPVLPLRDPVLGGFGFDRYATPQFERPGPGATFLVGRYGLGSWDALPVLSFSPLELPAWYGEEPFAAASSEDLRRSLDRLLAARPAPSKPCLKRPVAFVRYGAESDVFSLLRCDGSLAPEAIDRLSVIGRPPQVERPALPLPEEPAPEAVSGGEWVAHVRLLNPRLAWAIEQIAESLPRRTLYVMSGYRPGGHTGLHGQGRALDFFVMGVSNERVYRLCRALTDMGCGYYPNNKFVHLDVRPPGTGRAFWIDTSGPGEPSTYVDAWPGVELGGASVWRGADR